MNKSRREKLRSALHFLKRATEITESVCDEEEDCAANFPENLQGTERYEKMEAAIDSMNEAIDSISDATDLINSALE